MNLPSWLQPQRWFGGNKQQSDEASAEEQADATKPAPNGGGEVRNQQSASDSLEGVSFYTMPQVSAAGPMTAGVAAVPGGQQAPADATKKMGIIIIAAGAVILLFAVAALVWYIFFSDAGQTTAPTTQTNTPAPAAQTPTASQQTPSATTTDVSEQDNNDTDEDTELTQVDCGVATWPAATSTVDAWSCVGERLEAGCLPARLEVTTATDVESVFVVSGEEDGACAVELHYPQVAGITDAELAPYAGTRLQCNQAIAAGGLMSDAQLAQESYRKAMPTSLTDGHTCSGTAVAAWEREQEAENDIAETPLVAGTDSDGDGLSNVEEQTVYVTAVGELDTDNDGYDDGVEVENGYNPAGEGSLMDSGLVALFTNSIYNYTFWYPVGWSTQTQANGETVLVTAPTGGFIQLVAHDNAEGASLAQWYEETVGEAATGVSTQTKNNFSYIESEDGLTVYGVFTDDPTTVFVMTYSPTGGRIEYRATFAMFVAHFERL